MTPSDDPGNTYWQFPDPTPSPAPRARPAGPVQPLGRLTTWVVAASVLMTVGALITVAAALGSADRLEEARPGEIVLTPYDVASFVRFPLMVLALIVTSVWLLRARQNVTSLRPHVLQTRSPAWVVLGWMVPVVSLWFPFQVVRDIRRETSGAWTPPGFGTWWALFLVTIIIDGVLGALAAPGTGQVLPYLAAVVAPLWIAALVSWLQVVRSIAQDQEQLVASARA